MLVLLFSLGFAALYMEVKPFQNASDNTCGVASQWCISLTLMGSLMIKVNATDEGLGTDLLGVFLIVINVGVMVLAAVTSVINDDDVRA